MHFILVRPYDDKGIVELLAVQHPKKPFARFQEHWDKALAKTKQERPETWTVDEVFQILEQGQGWTIMKLDPLTVEY